MQYRQHRCTWFDQRKAPSRLRSPLADYSSKKLFSFFNFSKHGTNCLFVWRLVCLTKSPWNTVRVSLICLVITSVLKSWWSCRRKPFCCGGSITSWNVPERTGAVTTSHRTSPIRKCTVTCWSRLPRTTQVSTCPLWARATYFGGPKWCSNKPRSSAAAASSLLRMSLTASTNWTWPSWPTCSTIIRRCMPIRRPRLKVWTTWRRLAKRRRTATGWTLWVSHRTSTGSTLIWPMVWLFSSSMTSSSPESLTGTVSTSECAPLKFIGLVMSITFDLFLKMNFVAGIFQNSESSWRNWRTAITLLNWENSWSFHWLASLARISVMEILLWLWVNSLKFNG